MMRASLIAEIAERSALPHLRRLAQRNGAGFRQRDPRVFQSVRRTHHATTQRHALQAATFLTNGVVVSRAIAAEKAAVVASDILLAAQDAAVALVLDEQRRTLSRMTAYINVAARIGATPDWLRAFVNGYGSAKPDLVVGFNILLQFSRLQAAEPISTGK